MKKFMISMMLILAIFVTFVACGEEGGTPNSDIGSDTTQETPTPEVPKTVYDILNELSSQSYSQVKLNISTITGDIELKASYTLTKSAVSYSVEQLNLLPEDGNIENLSPDYKLTLNGMATIEEEKVTEIDGDAVSIPSYDELKGTFAFEEGNFKNVQKENGKLSAEVVSASDFLGVDTSIQDMKIVVEYGDTALQKMTITYSTNHSAVTTVYEFDK